MPSSQNIYPVFPRIDHIDLTINDLEETRKFYTELFVQFLGWEIMYNESDYFMVGKLPGFRIGFSLAEERFMNESFNRYKIGLHHFALEVENKDAVDKIYTKLLGMKVKILGAPQFYPNYKENYYALYWEDPNGFKMEFMCYTV